MTFFALSRLAREQLPSAVELDRLCFGGLWTLAGYERELASPNSDLLVLAHRQGAPGSSLVGLACLWAILEEAHITILGIHPEYRGQGLGQAMLLALLRLACHRGLERATLEVRASNFAALSLYQKFGFKEAGRRRRYYQDNGEDALVLWQSGLQSPEFAQNLARWEQQIRDRLVGSGSSLETDWQMLWATKLTS